MFGNDERDRQIETLNNEVRNLRERLSKVEAELEPFRVGEYNYLDVLSSYLADRRPKVTHAEAITLLLRHCGVEFKHTPGTPASTALEKVKK